MSCVAHQYSRVNFYSSLEVNLSLYYGGVVCRETILYSMSVDQCKCQWLSEDVRGPWTTDSPGPLPILHNFFPLTPPPHTPLLRICTLLSLLPYMISIRHFLISTYFMVYFGNLGPFDDAMGKMGAPWWRNDKWDPLITWWKIRGHNGGPWWRNDELGPLLINMMGN